MFAVTRRHKNKHKHKHKHSHDHVITELASMSLMKVYKKLKLLGYSRTHAALNNHCISHTHCHKPTTSAHPPALLLSRDTQDTYITWPAHKPRQLCNYRDKATGRMTGFSARQGWRASVLTVHIWSCDQLCAVANGNKERLTRWYSTCSMQVKWLSNLVQSFKVLLAIPLVTYYHGH
jgi:hypothetical protein